MTRRDKLRAGLDALEDEFRLLIIEELEAEIAGGYAAYIGQKMRPIFARTPVGRRLWKERDESLVNLERKIVSLRESLGEEGLPKALVLVNEYIAALEAVPEPFPRNRKRAEELLIRLRNLRSVA